jgi:hypothetical protein
MADLFNCIRTGVAFAAAASLCGVAAANDASTPEDIGNALPLSVAGDSCGAGDSGELSCQGFLPIGGEDYWYLWTSPITGDVVVDVCDASFDSVIEAFDALSFVSIACNDDACGDLGFRSQMVVSVTTGQAIIIGVDSYGDPGASCGTFTMNIEEVGACPDTTCPPGGIEENEPCRDLETQEDVTNGGCNFASMLFGSVARGDVICGNTWTQELSTGATSRDTDWYLYDHPGGSLEVTLTADMPAALLFVTGDFSGSQQLCLDTLAVPFFDTTGAFCGTAELNLADVACDEYVIFAGAQFVLGFDCGDASYILEVDGEGVCLPPCPWDFNGDGDVDSADLVELLSNWGPCPGT